MGKKLSETKQKNAHSGRIFEGCSGICSVEIKLKKSADYSEM
jgi:hypothetical protein